MPELYLPQSAEDRALLEQEAKRLGITPEQLAKDVMQREITSRTKPKTSRGVVQPFRRREKD
uniref:Uncharacterized protein n=1 Tax=viral metagenome TaxID=1070528 RepID=A0A6M3MHK6_9ZZZZ